MGNSISETDRSNFNILIVALEDHNIDGAISIIENGKCFNFSHNNFYFYHYLVMFSTGYSRENLIKLCDVIYMHRNKFASHMSESRVRHYLHIKFDKVNRSFYILFKRRDYEVSGAKQVLVDGQLKKYPVIKPYDNIYDVYGLDAMALCLKIRNNFLIKNNIENHMDVVIELFNKLDNKHVKPPVVIDPLCTCTNRFDNKHVKSSVAIDPLLSTNKFDNKHVKPSGIIDPLLCTLCKVNKKNIVIKDCNHVCVCSCCAKSLKECPICKVKVDSFEEIYL